MREFLRLTFENNFTTFISRAPSWTIVSTYIMIMRILWKRIQWTIHSIVFHSQLFWLVRKVLWFFYPSHPRFVKWTFLRFSQFQIVFMMSIIFLSFVPLKGRSGVPDDKLIAQHFSNNYVCTVEFYWLSVSCSFPVLFATYFFLVDRLVILSQLFQWIIELCKMVDWFAIAK
jgi:hypothetical protein